MLIRVVDFETTGYPPDAGIVEVGWTDINLSHIPKGDEAYSLTISKPQSELTNPGKPIEFGAMGAHHIEERDIEGKRSPDTVLKELTSDVDLFCAHNARFEQEFFNTDGTPWICTYKLALRCVPTAPNHKNQTLRYFLKLDLDRELAFPAHRGGPDSYVTAHILAKFIKDLVVTGKVTLDQIVKWSAEPPIMPTCPIGKARGKPWAEVEMGFLMWCTRQPTMEKDILYNVEREIKRRQRSQT